MNTQLDIFKKITTNVLLVSVALEMIFFFSIPNILASVVLLYGWLLIKTVVLTNYNMINYPVSFLMIFGLALFHYILPLPLTLFELKEVTYNLVVPMLTFWHHFLFVTIIVFTYKLYISLSNRKNVFRNILVQTDFYKSPSDRIIWISSFLGLFASFYNYFIFGANQKEHIDRGLLYYIAGFFIPFLWMPVIIPFRKLRNLKTEKVNASLIVKIIIYSCLVLIIALVSNMRTILFTGISTFFLVFVIGVLFGYYDFKRLLTIKRMIIFGLILFVSIGPLVDLGITMVIVRGDRGKLSTTEFIGKTISVFQDKKSIQKIKDIGGLAVDTDEYTFKKWNEDYLQNLFLNRFVNLKISDNCLYNAQHIGYQNPKMQEMLYDKIIASLPNAIIGNFGMSFEKKVEIEAFSFTDYLYSLSVNDPAVKGCAIIGTMPGLGMAIFGYWYLLIIVPVFVILFYMFDSFVNINNGKIIFSYLFFMMLILIVNNFNDRHVYIYEFRLILRGYIEYIVLFILTMKFVRYIESFLFAKKI